MEYDRQDVISVIVTYQPNGELLRSLLLSLIDQVSSAVVVDNGSNIGGLAQVINGFSGRVELIQLDKNYGIAKAQNEGIQFAKDRKAGFVLLMDQDSIPAPDMVKRLLQAMNGMQNVASVGPCYVDNRQGESPPFIGIQGLRRHRHMCEDDSMIIPVDHLISSGSLIPLSVIEAVGAMREELFIDYVDVEWGLRAKRHGYQSYGVCGAKMWHSLGEDPISFFGRTAPCHQPIRHYYQFRNAIWLYRHPWVPIRWKVVDAWWLLRKYVFYSLFARPRAQHIKMMSLGLLHGFMGRMGAFDGLSLRMMGKHEPTR